ncbi:MAG: hypothetical protein LBS43_10275 [Prevotellaceae bacterium]|jgi:hypothetical protein|nr:hypothetical protein [Prevotellaceae bacterium]
MDMNKMFIFTMLNIFLMFNTASVIYGQYRVKHIVCEDFRQNTNTVSEMDFVYNNNQLTSIVSSGNGNVRSDVYAVEQKKLKIALRSDKFTLVSLELDKKGNIEQKDDIKFDYDKSGLREKVTFIDSYNKRKTKYKLLYYDSGQLAVMACSENDYSLNYLLYYNAQQYCEKAVYGNGDRETVMAEWDNGKLKKISGYINRNTQITIHEFIYDNSGKVVEEKIYVKDKNNVENLVCHYHITYEEGVGNEDLLYFDFLNWKVNMFFNQRTCYPYRELRY